MMKKILALTFAAILALSVTACNEDNPAEEGTGNVEYRPSTGSTTAETMPPEIPVAITLDQVNEVIAKAKADYAAADELTLSDGTVLSAVHKDPGITKDQVNSGEATREQMVQFAEYIRAIRTLSVDRLKSYFPKANCYLSSSGKYYDYLFLDPAGAGFIDGDAVFAKMLEASTTDYIADAVVIIDDSAVFMDAETDESTLLCPTDEENDILSAVVLRMYPPETAESTETAETTETEAVSD